MPTFHLSTARQTRNPVRVQTWNASIRAGDDFKLALTVYNGDTGDTAQVTGSRSRLVLWPDERGLFNSPDYGWGWFTNATFGPGYPATIITGFTTPLRAGGINFAIPASATASLHGRYRLSIQIDLPDGEWSMIEGILQVREAWARPGLGHNVAAFFQLDVSQLDLAILAAALAGGWPADADGFLLVSADFSPAALSPPAFSSSLLGSGILGQMVLGLG